MIEIKKFFGDINNLVDTHYVRRSVFVEEQGFSTEDEFDNNDSSATHYVLYVDNQAVATARLRIMDRYAKIERVAVLQEQRGQRYGQSLISKIITDVKQIADIERILLISQLNAVLFYKRLGFNQVDGQIVEDGILCQKMQMTIYE